MNFATPTPVSVTPDGAWAISGWAALGGVLTVVISVGIVLRAAFLYGPPMIKWLKARYFPPFRVAAIDYLSYKPESKIATPRVVIYSPPGDYTITCQVQIGDCLGRYTSPSPRPISRRSGDQMWIDPGVTLEPPPGGWPEVTYAMVSVEFKRVNGIFLRSRASVVGRVRMR